MSVRDRYLSNTQTKGANANPRHRAIISRQSVQILSPEHLVFTPIAEGTFSRVAVAIKRPSVAAAGSMAYIAGINGGAAKIYALPLTNGKPTQTPTLWQTIAGAVDVALAFEGAYTTVARTGRVEFTTVGDPWVFWTDGSGNVYARHGTGTDELVASSAVSISAIMGVASILGAVSEGMILAYATNIGAVHTRQYLDGIWEDAVLCSTAPANVVAVALSRTWDYRVCMQLRVSSGAVYQMLGKSLIMGNANTEQIQVSSVDLTTEVYATIPHDTKKEEHIEVAAADLSANVYSAIAPTIVSVENIDDGTGNWGLILRVTFSGPVYDINGQAGAFVLGGAFTGEAIAYDPSDSELRTLLLTMADFNNAASPSDLVYTPGTLASGPSVTLVEEQTVSVTLVNLVPTSPPAPVSAEAVDNLTIDVLFDEALSSADIGANAAAFAVTGYEPAYSPGGTDVPTTYGVDSVEFAPDAEDEVAVDLAGGDLTDMEVV